MTINEPDDVERVRMMAISMAIEAAAALHPSGYGNLAGIEEMAVRFDRFMRSGSFDDMSATVTGVEIHDAFIDHEPDPRLRLE